MRIITNLLMAVLLLGLAACHDGQVSGPKTGDGQHQETKKERENMVRELTAEEFKQLVMNYDLHPREWVFEGRRPAMIDFYATWCGPCKVTAPIVEEMSKKYEGKVDFYKVDVDQQEELAAIFGIRSIPTLLFVPMDGQPRMQVGAMGREQMDSVVNSLLIKD